VVRIYHNEKNEFSLQGFQSLTMAGLSGTACFNTLRSPLTRPSPSAVLILCVPICSFKSDPCYFPTSLGAGRSNNLVCSARNKRAGGHMIHAIGAEANPTLPPAAKTSASQGKSFFFFYSTCVFIYINLQSLVLYLRVFSLFVFPWPIVKPIQETSL
jgi:hypothetical protein